MSVTHQHLLAVLNTELERAEQRDVTRLLDVGCGDGRLIAFLQRALPQLRPQTPIQLEGFDLSDRCDFPDSTWDYLERTLPGHDWEKRIACISSGEQWPYDDERFDFVISNQVLEHVQDLDAFMSETSRVLQPGGRAINLFPLRYAPWEDHIKMPLAQRVQAFEQFKALVHFWSRLRLGTYHRETRGLVELDRYAEAMADYVHFATVYRSWKDFVVASSECGLRVSYRYTGGFYVQKLLSLAGRELKYRYRLKRGALADALAFTVLRYVSSVTLVFEKPQAARLWLQLPSAAPDGAH